ncbi:heterokaryon incompatibility protein-domain-containing protein [Fusarium flagelliforme]|uniref:heterokaryon incompatibility protein-domain-containing protein n=1 Tax=Fusarium flagelliforme TaxID=2675880 RepID=UPI001E8D51E9|nr:heterokaryon incompatibility protein-domain-containing protein [Fusarium flagelliforme]KAH7174965.1 heterokaryon incompatibility protein-domain-containing protein [Fusarium flagelliforme]
MEPERLVCPKCWLEFFDTEAFERTCTAEDDHYSIHKTIGISTVNEIRTASSRCNWCSFIATFLNDSKPGETQIKTVLLPSRERYHATPSGRNVFFVRVYYLLGEEEVNIEMESLYAFTTSEDKASEYVTARPLRVDTWLDDCKDHEDCSSSYTNAPLPTRVIEVSPVDQEQPRVVESGGQRGEYTTLSYCWGKAPFQTLNTSNYAQCLRGLDMSTLPLTVQEAITVSRKLQIPYLWIDALCIIQDSENDKNEEISSMKDVYACSALTIVAASAKAVAEGFLQDRPNPKDIFTIPFGMEPDLFGSFSFGKLSTASYDERSEPLAKRAWTLQEQLLAQRSVTFTGHTMLWACKAGTRTFGDSFHYPYSDSSERSYTLNLDKLLLDEEEARACKFDALTSWCRLVTAYSLRFASLESDKLNAIAGVASLPSFSSALGPIYHAGMWTYKFALQLTWYVEHQHESLPGIDLPSYQPKAYRAPSWSWASIEGGVICFNDIFAPVHYPITICEIIECFTTPKVEEGSFGEIISGSLKLRGPVRRAWAFPQTSNLVLLPTSDSGNSIPSCQDAYRQHIEDFVAQNPDVDPDDETLHGAWNDNTVTTCDESRFTEPMLVFCLAVSSELGDPKSVSGLLLLETVEGTYTRAEKDML